MLLGNGFGNEKEDNGRGEKGRGKKGNNKENSSYKSSLNKVLKPTTIKVCVGGGGVE